MAEAVVASVVERIGDLMIEEANVLGGVSHQIEEILAEFRRIQGLLKYADTRKEHRVRVWVADVRKLVYDAEDVLESFVLKASNMKRGGIKNIFNFKRHVYHKFGSDIKAIKNKISELKARLQKDDMRFILPGESSSSANERPSELKRFYSYRNVAEVEVVGFKEDLDRLVKILEGSSDTCYRVVSICGMGGLGKTTLAKKIYNTPAIKSHFERLAWVSISQNLQKTTVLQRILVQLVPDPGKREEILKLSEDDLLKQVLEVQQSKNCLVIVDDIWTKEAWDDLRAAFPSGHAKSKLLLTSRNLEVAKHVDPEGFLYQPRILSEDESWELLAMKALPKTDFIENRFVKQMEEVGKKMVKHCKGLPLAIVVLGGILVTKPTLTEWELVFVDVQRSLREGRGLGQEHQKEVLEILDLSYTELPYQLKPCFIYLGTFLEDSVINTKKLYQMWMAEGLLFKKDRREGETMMDVAECYLGELAHRCMVEVEIVEDESYIRKLKSCRTHDLMRDLMISKAKEEDFFKPLDYLLVVSSSSSSTNYTQRLVINHTGEDNTRKDIPLDNEAIRRLRSLIFNGTASLEILRLDFPKFKLLKVLSIERRLPYKSKSARAIGYLKHLRYLSVKGFPSQMFTSLENMEYLQTLDLKKSEDFCPSTVKNMLKRMGRLLHLYLPRKLRFDKAIGKNKFRLEDLRNLETLKIFDPRWCEVKDIFNLTNLRELTTFVDCIEDLSEIINYHSSITSKNLRYSSLDIYDCDLSSDKGSFLSRQLLLTGGCRVNKLRLWKCKVKLQADDHVNFSSNLTSLVIVRSEGEELEELVAIVGKLPNLRRFSLGKDFQMTKLVCSATSFPQLRVLELIFLTKLERWRVDEGAMPCLSELKIVRCRGLEMLPDGIKFLTALRALEIEDMPEAFNDRIRVVNGKEGEDFHKVRHVPSITFR